MKTNEIGHFPYLPPQNQFDKGGYPREYLEHDEKGKLKLTKNGNLKWVTNWAILGEVETIDIPKNKPLGDILIDLQTSQDCYCADELVVKGKKYVYLRGSGWSDLGFPFWDKTFNPKRPHKEGKGCYALLRGQARDKFVELAKQGYIPSFKDIFTGDPKKDFVLPK